MSEAPHQSPIKTPRQLIALIVASFAVPIVLIILFATYANVAFRSGAGTDALSDEQVAKRIAPLAQVDVKDANAPRTYKTGEEVYKAVCVTCHGTGAAGAPKFGSKDDWAPRISQGFDTLLKTALAGKGAMPPRGGTSPDDYSDYEIARAIVYMANNDGANFPEPAAPAANATAAAGAAPASGAADAAIAAIPKAGEKPAAAPTSAAAASTGKALYTQVCQACHAAGVLNAPKFGSKEDWAPRLKEPMDTVYNYALHGKGAMPPKGGSTASDADVKAAVDYMVNAAK
ncbi:cytochrome C [Burkholderia ubonensis]|uniref:c-type cytochrome n=1 Tax=Burkholderia ubonensis TaxID=101571 RepID=UPI00092336A3|nr:c-type cytochrome [Burkholderia ubonensis]OJA37549.1 cytochrome C [Burkholderia ubonensis]